MKKVFIVVLVIFSAFFVGCSNSVNVENSNKHSLEEVSKKDLDSLNYVKWSSNFNFLELKEGYSKVFSDGGCTDSACDVEAISDGKKFYKLNKYNLQLLLKPYQTRNEVEEYFEVIYNSRSSEEIYFLEDEKSKFKISYCDFSQIKSICEDRGNLKFQEIVLDINFKELEINNLSQEIKDSDECIMFCYG